MRLCKSVGVFFFVLQPCRLRSSLPVPLVCWSPFACCRFGVLLFQLPLPLLAVRLSGFAKDMGKMAGELKDVPKEFQVSHSAFATWVLQSRYRVALRGETGNVNIVCMLCLRLCCSSLFTTKRPISNSIPISVGLTPFVCGSCAAGRL